MAFESLLRASREWKPDFNTLNSDRIDSEEAKWLEKPFTKEENFKPLLDFGGDKMSGLDSFAMAF